VVNVVERESGDGEEAETALGSGSAGHGATKNGAVGLVRPRDEGEAAGSRPRSSMCPACESRSASRCATGARISATCPIMTVPFVDKLRQCASSMISIHVAAMFLSGLISRLTRLARTSASCAEAAIVANELQACKPVCDRRSRVSGDVIYFRYRATAKRAVCARFNHAEVVLEKHDMTVGFITNITHDSLAH
jgi:hypothetical protein